MKKQNITTSLRFIFFTLSMLCFSTSYAWHKSDAFTVFLKDGTHMSFFYDSVQEMRYSKYDFDGIEHKEKVIQEIHTNDSIYRLLLSEIEEVVFSYEDEPYVETNKKEFEIPSNGGECIIIVHSNTEDIEVEEDIPWANTDIKPETGMVLIKAEKNEDIFERKGFVIIHSACSIDTVLVRQKGTGLFKSAQINYSLWAECDITRSIREPRTETKLDMINSVINTGNSPIIPIKSISRDGNLITCTAEFHYRHDIQDVHREDYWAEEYTDNTIEYSITVLVDEFPGKLLSATRMQKWKEVLHQKGTNFYYSTEKQIESNISIGETEENGGRDGKVYYTTNKLENIHIGNYISRTEWITSYPEKIPSIYTDDIIEEVYHNIPLPTDKTGTFSVSLSTEESDVEQN